MIIDKNIELRINGYNIRTYRDSFPNIKKGDTILVNQIRDLLPRSTVEVECVCSNGGCGEVYLRARRNIHTDTTYCSDTCRGESTKASNVEPRRKEIIEKFTLRIEKGQSIKYSDIKNDDSQLLYAMDKYYPLNEICKDLGISEDELVDKYGLTRNINKRTLSESEIIERLKYLKSIGRLTTSAMRTEFSDNRLENSIKKTYGSVEECFNTLGLERDIYHSNESIKMGREFERIFKNILVELKIAFHYQKPLCSGNIPDFFLKGESKIIDTKLSSWTTSISEDIEKYAPHCDELLFVYLRSGSTLPKDSSNVKFLNVKHYIEKLPIARQSFYNKELENILSYHPQP